MAASDYGVIVKHKGKIINKELYTSMEETLGFSNQDNELMFSKHFIYLGDADFYIGVYKNFIDVYMYGKRLKRIYDLDQYTYKGTKYRYKVNIGKAYFSIRRLDKSNRYYLRWYYRDHLYEIIYGYGVDLNLDYWYGLKPNLRRWLKEFMCPNNENNY